MRWYLIGFVVYSMLEFFLGKTKRVKANSTLELILNVLVGLGRILYGRVQRKE